MFGRIKSNTLFAGSVIYLGSNILNAAIPFMLLPILTRYLTPEEYGEVAMFQTWVGALNAFLGLSLHGAAIRKFYDGNLRDGELREFIGSCLQILIVTNIVCVLVVLLLQAQLADLLGLDLWWLFAGMLTTTSAVILHTRLGQWQVVKQPVKYGGLQISKSLFDMFISFFFVVVLLYGAEGRMAAQTLVALVFAGFSIVLLKRDELLNFFVWRPSYIREALRFGVPLIPHIGGMFFLHAVDRFIVNAELGLTKVGIYMVAVQFGMAISLVFDAVNKAYVPWLYEKLSHDKAEEKRNIVLLTYVWYVLIIVGVGIAFFIGPFLITYIAGENYAEAGQIFGWIALGHGLKGMYLMQTNYIFYSKRTGLLSLVTVCSGAVNIGLMLILIPEHGLAGAAYSFCVGTGLLFIFTWVVAQRRHPMPWLAVLLNKKSHL